MLMRKVTHADRNLLSSTHKYAFNEKACLGCISRFYSGTRVPSELFQKNSKEFSIVSKFKIYSELSKYRLSSLVVLTTGAGYLCSGPPIVWTTMVATCLGTAMCAASANTLNQIIEKKNDARMNRTRNRPLPSGRISSVEASAWALASGVAGTSILYATSNPVVALLGAGNIILYAGPYTISKQYSEINTWIGSLVGAIPPVMGYAAATGGMIMHPDPISLASILFLWQFPHFFALSWLYREDYSLGGYQMVSVNDPDGSRTAQYIWNYSLYLTAVPFLTSVTGVTSYMFAVEGTAANLYLLYLANEFKKERTNAKARKVTSDELISTKLYLLYHVPLFQL